MEQVAVQIEVRKQIHTGLVLDVAFEMGRECSILFGRSGCGKTTTLRLISGFVQPDAGRVRLDGESLFDAAQRINLPMRRRRIGLIFQDGLLFPHLSVRENILYGVHRSSRSEQCARLDELANLFALGPLLGRRPASLSGGEKQRVGLARALAPRPRLLLCDEPISAIDLEGRATLVAHLRRIQQIERIPVLYVTHSIEEAMAIGAHVFVLDQGRIIARGSPLDVFTEPRHLAIARLTGVRNIITGTVEAHAPAAGVTIVRLAGGAVMRVPLQSAAVGDSITFGLRADDILLACQTIAGISAQNILDGRVTEIVGRGPDIEVVIECGGVQFIASVVAAAVTALGLRAGAPVTMIIKARSCHVLRVDA